MDAGEGPGSLLPVYIQVKMRLKMVLMMGKVMVLRFIECSLRTRRSPSSAYIQVMRIPLPTWTKMLMMNKMMERRWMVLMMKKIEC